MYDLICCIVDKTVIQLFNKDEVIKLYFLSFHSKMLNNKQQFMVQFQLTMSHCSKHDFDGFVLYTCMSHIV